MSQLDSVIEGCRNGDAAMQRELYHTYSSRFYALCRRYTHDQSTADEVLTEGFVCIFRDIANYRGEGSFEGWMQTIFLRQVIKVYKRDSHHWDKSIDELSSDDTINAVTTEDHDKAMDIRDALEKSMKCLDNRQRLAFNMVAVEGYQINEAAKMLGLNLSTFKSHFYQAREKLQQQLTRRLGKQYINKLLH